SWWRRTASPTGGCSTCSAASWTGDPSADRGAAGIVGSQPLRRPLRDQTEVEVEVPISPEVQHEDAAGVLVQTGSARDREPGGGLRIEEGPLDGHLPVGQECRVHALPPPRGRAGAAAAALLAAHPLRYSGV